MSNPPFSPTGKILRGTGHLAVPDSSWQLLLIILMSQPAQTVSVLAAWVWDRSFLR